MTELDSTVPEFRVPEKVRKTGWIKVLFRGSGLLLSLLPALGGLAFSVGAEGTPESREPQMEDRGLEETVVFDFGPDAESWPNIDDLVMGGRSRCRTGLS